MGGKTSNESKRKYNEKTYDRIQLVVKKGSKEYLQTVAAENSESVNAYIIGAVNDRLKAEGRSELPTKATIDPE